jgi:cytochrome b pre-mRNA-processing protein 6
MARRLEKRKAQTPPSAAVSSIKSKDATVSAVVPQKWNEQNELEQANVLYGLLEDRYAKEFPLPQMLRRPASNPTYYDDLITEMQEAPTRSWIGSLIKRVQGSFRFS